MVTAQVGIMAMKEKVGWVLRISLGRKRSNTISEIFIIFETVFKNFNCFQQFQKLLKLFSTLSKTVFNNFKNSFAFKGEGE